MLKQNGHPLNLVKRKMKNTIDQFNVTKSPKTQKKNVFVPITCHGYEVILITNKIKSMIEKNYPTTNVIFGYKKGTSLSKIFSMNHKGIYPMNISVIYELEYLKCGKSYIEQTQFDVKHRMNQHKQRLQGEGKSAAVDHVLNNNGDRIKFDKPQIIARDKQKRKGDKRNSVDNETSEHI